MKRSVFVGVLLYHINTHAFDRLDWTELVFIAVLMTCKMETVSADKLLSRDEPLQRAPDRPKGIIRHGKFG